MNNEDEMEILTRYAKRAEEGVAAEREEAARGLLGFLAKERTAVLAHDNSWYNLRVGENLR